MSFIHPNLKLLSFSSRKLLHNCPRKFELYRIVDKEISEQLDSIAPPQETIHLDFGHLVGFGAQLYLRGLPQNTVWLALLSSFQGHLEEGVEDSKGQKVNKSFYHALHAVEQFSTLLQSDPLNQYELVYYNNNDASEAACELSFRIDMEDGYFFRGKLDALLRHKVSRRFAILETKTTSSSIVNEASYKNSEQGLGYSVVVDAIAHSLGETTGQAYDILYPVYQSRQMQWTIFSFPKTAVERALWLKDIMLDKALIQQYGAVEFFPKRGNNCFSYGRTCKYFDHCHYSNFIFTGKHSMEEVPLLKEIASDATTYYDFRFSIEELIEAERAKVLATSLEEV